MDGGGAGGGGGPAPFLQKTYDMVDDPATDDIVSWTTEKDSFVVWEPPEFAARLLPTYFKHNNFSSFIRQLNTYGFRKSDPERWEFTNPDFIKGQRHLLKNIHRRKPIHSHSNPPGGELVDGERTVLEEEIERLSREKLDLQTSLSRFRQQQSGTKIQLDDLERRLANMEQRQLKMITFMQRAMQNPLFMENLVKMASSTSVDFVFNRKRRHFSSLDYCPEPCENNFYDNHSDTSKPEIGHVLHREFSDKLTLELGSVIPDGKLVTSSVQNSNEGTQSSPGKQTCCGHETMECFPLVPDSLEIVGTGASSCPTKNLSFPRTPDDGDGLLNLTLASSSMQIDRREFPSTAPNSVDQGTIDLTDLRTDNETAKSDHEMVVCKQGAVSSSIETKATSLQETRPASNEASATPPGRVNDIFWEQFLTERPGALDNEEASSGLRTDSDERNIESKPEDENILRSKRDMEQLKL